MGKVEELTIGEIMETPQFKSNIIALRNEIANRPEPPKGMRYKRNAIDNLKEEGLFNVSSLVYHYILGENRKSVVKNSLRKAIKQIVEEAIGKTYYELKIEEAKKLETEEICNTTNQQ